MHHRRQHAQFALASFVVVALYGFAVADAPTRYYAMTNPSVKSTAKSAKPTKSSKSTAKAVAASQVPKQPVTISITSRIRHGNLIVLLDDVPVFNEKFEKPALLISQTTKWDPLQIPAGKHTFAAAVRAENGKSYASGLYELEISRTKGIALRIRMKGDKLTVEPES